MMQWINQGVTGRYIVIMPMQYRCFVSQVLLCMEITVATKGP
jgi:hypothetical protein